MQPTATTGHSIMPVLHQLFIIVRFHNQTGTVMVVLQMRGITGRSSDLGRSFFAAKRRGFPAGMYTINIPSHDDWAYLIIDGVEVWNHEDCCDYHADVWQGLLDRYIHHRNFVMEFGGSSYGTVELIRNNLNSKRQQAESPFVMVQLHFNISGTGGDSAIYRYR